MMSVRPLSAHIGYLFTELPFATRMGAARRAGFNAVEHPDPQIMAAGELRAILDGEGLAFAQMAVIGDRPAGAKGIAAMPGQEPIFRDRLQRALDFAEAIGCPLIHPMAGVTADLDKAEATYRDNLEYAVEQCRSRSIAILVEALSRHVVPSYFVSTLDAALELTAEYGPETVRLLVDTFHAAENGTNVTDFVSAHFERIGHIHIADHPGRHEPGTGRLDFVPLISALVEGGYRGAVGFEYVPKGTSETGLTWLPRWKSILQSAQGGEKASA